MLKTAAMIEEMLHIVRKTPPTSPHWHDFFNEFFISIVNNSIVRLIPKSLHKKNGHIHWNLQEGCE